MYKVQIHTSGPVINNIRQNMKFDAFASLRLKDLTGLCISKRLFVPSFTTPSRTPGICVLQQTSASDGVYGPV